MNDLTIFNFESNEVRVVLDQKGDPWFVLRDVLQAMGRKGVRTNEAKTSIDEGLGEGYIKTVPLQTAWDALNKSPLFPNQVLHS